VSAVRLVLGDQPEAELVARVAGALRRGGVALLPAEGVYGFHAIASSASAIERIRGLKRGEGRAGFIGLIGRPEDLARWTSPSSEAVALVRAHWPGALTLVLDALPAAPAGLRAEDGTVALRCPGSSFLRGVATAVGEIVLSTSANRSGEPPPARVEDAPTGIADLEVDAGPLGGRPSTLVRVGPKGVRILRQGAVRLGDGSLDGPPTEP
jgi:L-threonylcarbamoyladenylate synthase